MLLLENVEHQLNTVKLMEKMAIFYAVVGVASYGTEQAVH